MTKELDNLELRLIQEFKLHPFFGKLDLLTEKDFLFVLIQRRFLSLSIVNLYEFVIDAVSDEEIKQTIRVILNEEYPRDTKGNPLLSHRELLFRDLINLGATKEDILNVIESDVTKNTRKQSFELLTQCIHPKVSDIQLITFLRFWAEVLVSVEYFCLWSRISKKLSDGKSKEKERSEFYFFHMIHDSRASDIGKESKVYGLTHSQQLGIYINRLITSNEILKSCMKIEEQIFSLKYEFYTQFLDLV